MVHEKIIVELFKDGCCYKKSYFFFLFGFLNFCWCFSPIVRAFVVFASVFVVELHLYITDKLFVIRQ